MTVPCFRDQWSSSSGPLSRIELSLQSSLGVLNISLSGGLQLHRTRLQLNLAKTVPGLPVQKIISSIWEIFFYNYISKRAKTPTVWLIANLFPASAYLCKFDNFSGLVLCFSSHFTSGNYIDICIFYTIILIATRNLFCFALRAIWRYACSNAAWNLRH